MNLNMTECYPIDSKVRCKKCRWKWWCR